MSLCQLFKRQKVQCNQKYKIPYIWWFPSKVHNMDMTQKLIDFSTLSQTEHDVDFTKEDWLEDMNRDINAKTFIQAHMYETMFVDIETSLYVGSTKFTWLLVIGGVAEWNVSKWKLITYE